MEARKQNAQNARTQGETKQNPASQLPSKVTKLSTTATTADSGEQLSEHHEKILEARGLNVELCVRMGWRTKQKDTIEIPYYRDGVEVNCKTRTIEGEKRFYQQKDGEKCFYNVDALKEVGDETIIITEGEMDCLIALQCGFIAVSVPDGAPQQEVGEKPSVKYDYLKDVPKEVKCIILATDSDSQGVNLMNDLAIRLGKHRCKWVQYPKGCKDLNDAFKAYGQAGVVQTLQRAKYIAVAGLYRLSELPPLPTYPALDVGIESMKENLRLRKGDFSVVTGIPSHGKSTFANFLAYNMIQQHKWQVCFASFEQPPQTEHRDALHTLHNQKPHWKLTQKEKAVSDEWINNNLCFIHPDDESDDSFDLTWLLDACAAAVTRYGCDMVIIDPWNELDHAYNQRDVSLTQYVGIAIKELKRFAKRYQVHVMVIAHPTKMKKNKDGVYDVPTAYDISDSANWYNKADQLLIVHREADGTLVRVAKSRYHRALGKPGDVKLRFDEYDYTFYGVAG